MISYLDYPYRSGLSRRIEGISNALVSNGVNVRILCPRYRSLEVPEKRANVVRLDIAKLRGASLSGTLPKLIALLAFTVLVFKYILVHRRETLVVQYESLFSLPPAIPVKLITHAIIIGDDLIIREETASSLVGFLKRILEIAALRLTDAIITPSDRTIRILGGIFAGPQLYVPNGVKTSQCSEGVGEMSCTTKYVAIFVGAPSFVENRLAIEDLLHTLDEPAFEGSNLEVWVVGGALTDPKGSLCKKLIEHGVIKFLGHLDEEELDRAYRSAQVGLLPFFRPTQGVGGQRIKALEYFSKGLLVISSAHGVRGIEGLVSGVHYLSANSRGEMARILADVSSDSARYDHIAAQGRAHVCNNYDWQVVTKEYIQFVNSIFLNVSRP